MRKIFGLIMILSLSFVLISCKNEENPDDKDIIEDIEDKEPEEEIVYEALFRKGKVIRNIDNRPIMLPSYSEKEKEIRAIWISNVFNIDIPKILTTTEVSRNNYKKEIIKVLDNISKNNFNTIFFQIRPMNDAFYKSELAPWSRFITGVEGRDPGFDVLDFVIEEAHKRELELHGWLNPYRVSSNSSTFAQMSDKNFGVKNPELLLTDGTAHILDPGKPLVQKYINDVIKELLIHYPKIDGLHFDDYFYLSSTPFKNENESSPDFETYLEYRKDENQSIADFRRDSVTQMIKNVNKDINDFNNKNNTKIKFGVSPTGVWNNKSSLTPDGSETRGYQSYSQLYADTKLWVENNYIDYIVPQVYFEFTNSAAPFAHIVDWWNDVVKDTNVKLIIGQGLYRFRDGVPPFQDENEILDQLRYMQDKENVSGTSFFTYHDIMLKTPKETVHTMNTLKNSYWKSKVKTNWES